MKHKLLELWLNGEKCDNLMLSWNDTFRYALGCSTTFAWKNGHFLAQEQHFKRLQEGLAYLNYKQFSEAYWSDFVIRPLAKLNLGQAYRINVSIYPSPFSCLVSVYPLELKLSTKLYPELIAYNTYAGNKQFDFKPVSYLPSILARMDLNLDEQFDFIWCNQSAEAMDASTSALVCYYQGKLITPRKPILKSISLQLLNDFNFCLSNISKKILEKSDEIMLLNSVQGILPCDEFGTKIMNAYQNKDSQTNLMKERYDQLWKQKV
jgi:branched-subunit amino acid aminotransferase/4-amino-4-deoxychorismate lyase